MSGNGTDAGETAGEPVFHRLTVKAVHEQTAEARSFVLAPERGDAEMFRYLPGQFLSFRVPVTDTRDHIVRSYSLSSAPCADPDMTICVKRVANGLGSNWFHDHLRVGARLDATRPAGRFVLRASDAPVLLIAGGSGITPCLGLVKQALGETERAVKLLYVNQTANSVIYRDALSRLEERFTDRFICRHWFDDERGLLTAADIAAEATAWPEAESYVCGPTPLMELAEDTLDSLWGATARVLTERFTTHADSEAFAPGSPAAQADTPCVDGSIPRHDSHRDTATTPHPTVEGETANCKTARIKSFRLILDGTEQEVPIGAGETLLQAALSAGIDAPFSCTEGHCGMCMAQLRSGEVAMRSTRALSKRNKAHGLVLACQSTPASSEELLLNFDF